MKPTFTGSGRRTQPQKPILSRISAVSCRTSCAAGCVPEHIKDVQQETLLRAWAAIRAEGGVRQPERFGAFVSSVCNNILRESYRTFARTRALDDLQIDPADQSMSPDGMLLAAETKKQVQKVLGRLCPKDRKLLQEVFFEQRDKDEVCHDLGVSRDYLQGIAPSRKAAIPDRISAG